MWYSKRQCCVPSEGWAQLLLDLRENPPRQNVGFLSSLTFLKLHFSIPKTDILPLSPLLPKVFLTQKVKFELWEFVLKGSHHTEENLRGKFPRRVILRHSKQFSSVRFCLKISNSSWVMAAHLQENQTHINLELSWIDKNNLWEKNWGEVF